MSERGQASVELVACAALLALVALAAVQWLAVVRAHVAAERIADQVAVLVAEGHPVPRSLGQEAKIARDGRRLRVTVRAVAGLPGIPAAQSATVLLPR